MVIDDHNFFMRLALKEAWKYQGLTYPNPAVGCTVVDSDGRLLAVEAHHKAGGPHAEVNALKSAYYKLTKDQRILSLNVSSDIHEFLLQNHNGIFKELKLYTTLEPCSHHGQTPSCASLINQLGIKSVYIGANDMNPLAKAGGKLLEDNNCTVHYNVLEKESEALLQPFRLWQKRNFAFFKWAQRMDGSVNDGIISSVTSRKHVHSLRNVCDLLVIGGESVRIDRPTLDARLVDGKAPDILIVSKQKDFDRTIPLFQVKNRKVFIESDFSRLNEYKNIMIEGGVKMFELSKSVVDYYLSYIAPSFGGHESVNRNSDKFEILNLQKETQDIIVWMKRIEGN